MLNVQSEQEKEENCKKEYRLRLKSLKASMSERINDLDASASDSASNLFCYSSRVREFPPARQDQKWKTALGIMNIL